MIKYDTLYIEGDADGIIDESRFNDTVRADIAQSITSLRVNYGVSSAAQLTVELVDYQMKFWTLNYFQIGTTFLFKGERFRLASAEIRQGEGEWALVKLELRTESVQRMKENKKPQSFKSATGFEFAQRIAKEYNLIPVIQVIPGIKQSTIKVKEKNNRESVWDVLQRAASDIQFLCFVSENRLVFASPQWLLGRWGLETTEPISVKTYGGKFEERALQYIPFIYPADRKYNFFLLEMPNMRRSEDSPRESEGSVQLWAGDQYEDGIGSAYNIRAGMTGFVFGIPGFDQAYIITSVDYQFGVSEPVEIALATVDKLAPEEARKIKEKIQEVVVIQGTGGD